MRLLPYLTAQNVALADAVRGLVDASGRTRYSGVLRPGTILQRLAPEARPDRMVETQHGLMVTLAHPDGRWDLVRIDYDYDRSSNRYEDRLGWSRMVDTGRIEKMLLAFIDRRQAANAAALLDTVAAIPLSDEWDQDIPVGCFAAALVLTSTHPDMKAAAVLWGLGGFERLRSQCEAEDFNPLDPDEDQHQERYTGFDGWRQVNDKIA